LDCLKLENFCTSKETIEWRDELQNWRKSLPDTHPLVD
jgi:hypothetical protein